ncbi:MAG: trehalose-phosphatase [Terriglobales bacterium]
MLQLQSQKFHADAQGKLSRFFAKASCTTHRALLLDYDGTIAPFCADRGRAVPYPGVLELLDNIRSFTSTRLVVATGRRALDAAQLLGLKRMEVWGCHGLERLHVDGTYEMPELDDSALQAISTADELLANEGLSGLVEYKPAATAVHWRGLEPEEANMVMRKVQAVWSMLPDTRGLCFLKFDGGLEIRAAIRNKGDVVRTIVAEMGRGASIAYLGDDQTDEHAFAALQGFGLSVLVQPEYRPTVADVWVSPPEGVIAFLTDWFTACGGAS